MVARMIRWPWPPIMTRKFVVRLAVHRIEGAAADAAGRMTAEVRWKGPKMTALSSLRRTVKRNLTRAEVYREDKGEVEWNEVFESVVGLTPHKENAFNPWEVEIVVFYGLKKGSKDKASVVGRTSLNIAEYASSTPGEEIELNCPLLMSSVNSESRAIVHLTLKLLELRTCPVSLETVQGPIIPAPLSPAPADSRFDKDDISSLKAGLRRVKVLTELVSTRKSKKTCNEDEGSDSRGTAGSEEADCFYLFDSDSFDGYPDEELEGDKDDTVIRKSFSYGTLATVNHVDGAFYCDKKMNEEYEDLIYYSHRRSDVGSSHVEDAAAPVQEQSILHTTKRSILPWKRRKYSYRSPRDKGEPLLKKAYGEEGGDDIDYDRRQMSSSDESFFGVGHKSSDDGSAHGSSISDFGDDHFAVGSWESKEIISRDGHMKLSTQVFFASIDQRSERASGESACTALVAVIADWFQSNSNTMPIKSQFDSLIREGSLEWRKLCENQMYRERFPDRHFDLETILQAKIRPLSVVPEKSFVGFFNPEGCEDNRGFEFLHGAMTFDSIWDEITQFGLDCLYIISWNDHFFILKAEEDAYYIIDTLGERLYEGCRQAYILKFDDNTSIHRMPAEKEENRANTKEGSSVEEEERKHITSTDEIIYRGKESCKEYIKSFLAAIPIRELQADIMKGLISSSLLHHRLQIEFHYTEYHYPVSSKELTDFAAYPLPPFWPVAPSPVRGITLTMAAVEVA
ncbi:hypothetical protein AXF42_Ash010462 [Apostasia shenzhenica]|uniref:C2 NT-type domain-containing protein n=1 Tax=Apostasia shenzhenica TaxID=1088818 RepID=A0A2I0BE23_9ASPA|nr:hypothetical protein AXF42_Ash010462 [Apostasia shenzhenica]